MTQALPPSPQSVVSSMWQAPVSSQQPAQLPGPQPLELPKLEKSKYVRPPIQEQNFIPLIYR